MSNPLEEVVAHPLFPVDEDSDDDEIRTVTSIHIARKENGKLMFAPRPRRADELSSLEQIHAEFGGGEYVLIGYNNGRITARRTINLSGKSKPLFDDGIEPAGQHTEKPAAPSQVLNPMQAMMGGGGEGGIMGLIMMMMQQMMQAQAQAAQNQTQMFLAMMTNTQQQSSEEKAAARAELQANIERERQSSERTMALMREMMTNRNGGSGEDFTRGVEFMRTFATQQIEVIRTAAKGGETDWEGLIETGLQALSGAMQLKNMMSGTPSPEVVAQAAQ